MESTGKSGRTRIAVAGAVALAVGAFASLGATGYAARLVALAHTTPAAARHSPSKVTICHHTHSEKNPFVTIAVAEHALPAHVEHGDTAGPCSEQAPAAPAAAPRVHKAKLRKAHKARPSGKKSRAHAHVKKAKAVRAKSGQAPATVHGTAKTKTHGSKGKGHEKRKTHGRGHTKPKAHGTGRGHGPGNGHGNEKRANHGQGTGDTHGGQSGGGKGKGH